MGVRGLAGVKNEIDPSINPSGKAIFDLYGENMV